jgi:DNA polymerase-3 subunit delta'
LRIGKAIENKTLPHAFLINGPLGSGKSTLATEIAAAVNCAGGNTLPCGVCNNCRRIYSGNFPDVKILAKKKDKATLGVEAVKDFREDMFLSSTESEHKIYIIDDAECMTVEAQNALLKVLEEPPKSVIIILLANECDRILTTIKSRAQSVAMQRFDTDELKKYLSENAEAARLMAKTPPMALEGILLSSDGRIGRALSLLSEKEAKENAEDRLIIEKVITALRPNAPYSELYAAISALPTARVDFIASLESLVSAIRDVVLVKFDKSAPLLFYADRGEVQRIAETANIKRLLTIYETIQGALEDASKNVSTAVISSNLCAKITLI